LGAEEASLVEQRQAIARDFYRRTGFDEARIESHLNGIDFSQPVEVVTLPAGTQLSQRNFPGELGNYFAELGKGPQGLGVYTNGRVESGFTFLESVQALRSTAADAADFWSVRGWTVQATGGETQYFLSNQSLGR